MFITLPTETGPVLVNINQIQAIYVDRGFTGRTVVRTSALTIYTTESFDNVQSLVTKNSGLDMKEISG